jgi:nicotinate dehydrogenase subunit B
MAMWNALHLDPGPLAADPARSAEWNRGRYLVEGAGHCGACHTPRNAIGAEKGGDAYLAGAVIDGWEAPALTAMSLAPVPWTVDEFERYLRDGHTLHHGSVAGPMAPVVRELGTLPAADLRAMAVYLASLGAPVTEEEAAATARAAVDASVAIAATIRGPAQRLFEGACGACHHDGAGPVLLGRNLPLALHTSLSSERPDNLIRAVLDGIAHPATRDLGFMPAFRHALNDRQIAELAAYMRERFAPSKPAWNGLEAEVARIRTLTPE